MANYDDDYNNNDDAPRRSGNVEQAKSKTQFPGILLIIMGVLTLLLAGFYLVVSMPDFQKSFESSIQQRIEAIEKDAQLPAEQKKAQADGMKKVLEAFERTLPNLPIYGVISGVSGLLMILGGVKFMSLGSKALVIIASILTFTPFTAGCCCVIGIPVGIWVLIALNNQTVRDGYAALARRANSRYEE